MRMGVKSPQISLGDFGKVSSFMTIMVVSLGLGFLITFISPCLAQTSMPKASQIGICSMGLSVTMSWEPVAEATGYTLFYAPYPSADPIEKIDLGYQTHLAVTLWDGAAFYVALQAYNDEGQSHYSNVEYFRLNTPRISLPADDGIHEAPVEWWYWTGHLQDELGHWYGFEEVFFLVTYQGSRFVMAHHAITDIESEKFQYDIRYSLKPPEDITDGFSFTVGEWTASGGGGRDRLHGILEDYELDLELNAVKAPVFQHGNGYIDYHFGGYTYYYSRERMSAQGTLKVNGQIHSVNGAAWFDHQWGAFETAVDVGWDWFAIQLEDGQDIMLAIVRGEGKPLMEAGSIVDAQEKACELSAGDFTVTALGEWTSPTSGCTYPLGWDVTVNNLSLRVMPVLQDQELIRSPVPYWEGAATVEGDAMGRAYVELTGYCP